MDNNYYTISFEQVASQCEITVDQLITDLSSNSIYNYLKSKKLNMTNFISWKNKTINFSMLSYIKNYYK